MNPGTSARNTSGTLNASHSQMKRAALSAESTNSTPPRCFGLLARIPTGIPSSRANPTMSSRAHSGFSSKNEPSSTSASSTLCMSYARRSSTGTISAIGVRIRRAAQPARSTGGGQQPVRRQVRQETAGLRDRVLVGGAQVVATTADGRVHARPAHLVERHVLADHDLGHARRTEVHRGVALDHEHDVAERGDVRAARGRRAEQATHLRHLARQAHLVGEDAARAPAAGEQVDLVGDAGAGGVDEIDDG